MKSGKKTFEGIIQKTKNQQLSFTKSPPQVSLPSQFLLFLPHFLREFLHQPSHPYDKVTFLLACKLA